MKSLTKKAIMLSSAIAVAGTFAVCAETVTISDATYDAATNEVTVNFATDVADPNQLTILAYEKADAGSEQAIDNSTIVYIDQNSPSGFADATVKFKMRDGFADGTYSVLMGGTNVAEAATSEFTIASAPTGSTVSGTVGPLVYWTWEEIDTVFATTATLLADDMETPVGTVTVDAATAVDARNAFSFEGIADGTYYLALSRNGMCTKYVTVTVAGGDVALGDKTLLGADVDGNVEVNGSDVLTVLQVSKQSANMFGEENYNSQADVDGDGTILPSDVLNTLATSKVADYHEW